MSDAWSNLLSHSTISSGDAWEHLLAQGGGSGGPCDDRYVADEALSFTITPTQLSFSMATPLLTFAFKDQGLEFIMEEELFDITVQSLTMTMKEVGSNYTYTFKEINC